MDFEAVTDGQAGAQPPVPSRDFIVDSQKLEFEIDFLNQALKGKTAISIVPLSKQLRTIRLDCRQCTIRSVQVEKKPASFSYSDPYKRIRPNSFTTAHQHHIYRAKLDALASEPREGELAITLPRSVPILEVDQLPKDAQNQLLSRSNTAAGAMMTGTSEQTAELAPITITIDFDVRNARDGVQFVGITGKDARYPHMYTRNSMRAGMACCLFPCVDEAHARCTWEIQITCPRTLGDAFRTPPTSADGKDQATTNVLNLNEVEEALELIAVSSGTIEDEIIDDAHPTKKTFTYNPSKPFAPNQIGFAVGPFEDVELSEYREIDEDEKLGDSALKVHGYCLPGRADEVRNTCMPLAKATDFFTTKLTKLPFDTYRVCFVDDLQSDTIITAGLALCSTRLLFPDTIIDPLVEVTRTMIHALASQYFGIITVPKEPTDTWLIVGLAYFITDLFLKDLMGKNEYRWRQKADCDRICQLDVERPNLAHLGTILYLDPSEYDFLATKSTAVLFILDQRLIKTSGMSGLLRMVTRMTSNAQVDDIEFVTLSLATFQRIVEKMAHLKFDQFFQQWVFGAGTPHFLVSQRFNKKKLVVEMLIEQKQVERSTDNQDLNPDNFLRDVREDENEIWAEPIQPVFQGPMTIRIHEADGTPYEHVVEIKEQRTKFEIPYNTKYKRLKRSRRQKERVQANVGSNPDPSNENQDDVLLYCLGDTLQEASDVSEWYLQDWSQKDEEDMNGESYEWIRMDADFEWICRMNINMPAYMYVSQLQQDRDVVAQLESMQYIETRDANALMSTFLIRTLMDGRYFHGIRTMAARCLTKCATDTLNWIGLLHLEKAFREFYGYPGSPMTRPNDFSDRQAYLVQCAIAKAIAKVKGTDGHAPMRAKRFFIDKLKFNDNTNNEFSDAYYVSTLISGLAETLSVAPDKVDVHRFEDREEQMFKRDALNEIERYRRIDEWISSYQNIYSSTALDCILRLIQSKVIEPKPKHFLQYVRIGNLDNLRLKAMECLSELKEFKNTQVLQYLIYSFSVDSSPYMREQIARVLGNGFAKIAMGEKVKKSAEGQDAGGGLILDIQGTTVERQEDLARRQTIPGALAALKIEMGQDEGLKEALWAAASTPTISSQDLSNMIDFCFLLYEPRTSLVCKFKYPHYWRCERIGPATLKFSQTEKLRTKPIRKLKEEKAQKETGTQLVNGGANPPKPAQFERKPSISLNTQSKQPIPPASFVNGTSGSPPPLERRPTILKLKVSESSLAKQNTERPPTPGEEITNGAAAAPPPSEPTPSSTSPAHAPSPPPRPASAASNSTATSQIPKNSTSQPALDTATPSGSRKRKSETPQIPDAAAPAQKKRKSKSATPQPAVTQQPPYNPDNDVAIKPELSSPTLPMQPPPAPASTSEGPAPPLTRKPSGIKLKLNPGGGGSKSPTG